MKSRLLCLGLIANLIGPVANSTEVLELRTSYWEFTWNLPDEPPTRELVCLTPEHLESLRFFSARDSNCHNFEGGQQTRTTWHAQASCTIEGVTGLFKYDLVARDAMTLQLTTTVTAEDQSATGHATARWVQEACDTSHSHCLNPGSRVRMPCRLGNRPAFQCRAICRIYHNIHYANLHLWPRWGLG